MEKHKVKPDSKQFHLVSNSVIVYKENFATVIFLPFSPSDLRAILKLG